MDDRLFTTLLHTSEGPALDVKEQQYAFGFGEAADAGPEVNAARAEFVKDVLALANSWRQGAAYILIGIREGTPHEVVGEGVHPDDATLQQLVNGDPRNGRCNRRLDFSYSVHVDAESGRRVGVVAVPPQRRPLYLLKQYGRLKPQAVFVRQGSSTVEATPDEVARMGAAEGESQRSPALAIRFADVAARRVLDSIGVLRGSRLPAAAVELLPDYSERSGTYPYVSAMENRDYYRDAACHLNFARSAWPLGLLLENAGAAAAAGVTVVIETNCPEARLVHPEDAPDEPTTFGLAFNTIPMQLQRQRSPLSVAAHTGGWQATLRVGDIPPAWKQWLELLPYLEVTGSCVVQLTVHVFANNVALPVLIAEQLHIDIDGLNTDAVAEYLATLFKSPEE